jgi:hypothetical protein
MNSNEFYKLKYQKYKNKYISLKNKNLLDQKGGIADNTGEYYFYVSIDSVTYQSSNEQKWNSSYSKSWWEQKYNLKHNNKSITSEKELKEISFCFYCVKGNDGADCDKKINFRAPCDKLSEQQKNNYSVVSSEQFNTLFPITGGIRKPTNANLKKYFIIVVKVNKFFSNEILSIRYVVEPWQREVSVHKDTEGAYVSIFTPP